jgi:hypothetical protein
MQDLGVVTIVLLRIPLFWDVMYVVGLVMPGVLKDCSASMFRVTRPKNQALKMKAVQSFKTQGTTH